MMIMVLQCEEQNSLVMAVDTNVVVVDKNDDDDDDDDDGDK